MHIFLAAAAGFGGGIVVTALFGARALDALKKDMAALLGGVEARLQTSIQKLK